MFFVLRDVESVLVCILFVLYILQLFSSQMVFTAYDLNNIFTLVEYFCMLHSHLSCWRHRVYVSFVHSYLQRASSLLLVYVLSRIS